MVVGRRRVSTSPTRDGLSIQWNQSGPQNCRRKNWPSTKGNSAAAAPAAVKEEVAEVAVPNTDGIGKNGAAHSEPPELLRRRRTWQPARRQRLPHKRRMAIGHSRCCYKGLSYEEFEELIKMRRQMGASDGLELGFLRSQIEVQRMILDDLESKWGFLVLWQMGPRPHPFLKLWISLLKPLQVRFIDKILVKGKSIVKNLFSSLPKMDETVENLGAFHKELTFWGVRNENTLISPVHKEVFFPWNDLPDQEFPQLSLSTRNGW